MPSKSLFPSPKACKIPSVSQITASFPLKSLSERAVALLNLSKVAIGEYFLSVIAASVITALVSMILGDGKSVLIRSIDTVCSLFLLCVIVSPISIFIARAKDGLDIVNIADTYESTFSAEEAIYSSLVAVSGEKIEAVHMLPGYTHNIINLSETEDLVTVMWANEQFDPNKPDTFFEVVE